MATLKTDTVSRGWLGLGVLLIALELVFLYEAMAADMGGYQKIFAVLAGLSILCFAALLYAVALVFYGWD
jgi:hypothetical protein